MMKLKNFLPVIYFRTIYNSPALIVFSIRTLKFNLYLPHLQSDVKPYFI